MKMTKWIFSAICLCAAAAGAETVRNPTRLVFRNEPVLLKLSPPDGAPTFHVARDGQIVPSQAEVVDGRRRVRVLATLGPGESADYEIRRGSAPRAAGKTPPAPIRATGDAREVELDNGRIAVRVGAGGPLLAVRIGAGPWRGRSASTPDTAARERVEISRGDVFAEAAVIGEYPNGGRRRFTVRLYPDRPYALIAETHENAPEFVFDLAAGWPQARRAVARRWYSGPFQAAGGVESFDLSDAATRIPDAVLRALPRWTQSYDEGWFIGVADENELIAALPIRAGRWVWPHDNALTLSAPPSADGDRRGLLRGPAIRGARQWLLLAGERTLANDAGEIARRECFAPLDKLHNEYVLDWPGLEDPAAAPVQPRDFYSNQTNPTDILRRLAREELGRADQPARSLQDLYDAQAYLDPDWYGTYENFWSPINPNFYTDFIKLGVLKTARLREHPRFGELRRRAVAALRADLTHAVTLPGGAGQECPGYLHHAAEQWATIAPIVGRYLGFDMHSDPRWRAIGHFLAHSSVPVGGGRRRFHPAGDTHPDKPDPLVAAQTFGYRVDPRAWRTEELPGFGVIFRHRCGESDETFLSFKAGPNRGHYHGDSLSFHLAFNGRDAAPDHRVSYFERPGQEHLHNRVAFESARFPFANMDGFERLIAFKTSEHADVAVAQVESPRLREVKPLPPEEWDQAYPQQNLSAPLVYRRTIVLVRRGDGVPRDLFILRDQFWSDPRDGLRGRYYLHVKGEGPRAEGRAHAFGSLTLLDASPEPGGAEPFHWEPRRGDLRGEATRGVRIAVPAREGRGEIVTVLWPGGNPPPLESAPSFVRIGPVEVCWGGNAPDAAALAEVRVGGAKALSLVEADTDFDRSQGNIGLFVPSVGYPFGPLPDWLIRQRAPLSRGAAP